MTPPQTIPVTVSPLAVSNLFMTFACLVGAVYFIFRG